jgi:hypothetical protein
MDLSQILAELHEQLRNLKAAIAGLEFLLGSVPRRVLPILRCSGSAGNGEGVLAVR